MDLLEAKKLALSKMKEFGLPFHSFGFSRAVRTFGSCDYRRMRIELSAPLVEANTRERVLLTIIHEIAHALTPMHGHDWIWKSKCLELGGDGERCYTSANVQAVSAEVKKPYIYVCKCCGREVTYYKRIKKVRACGKCCREHNNGKFSNDFLLEFKA